MQKHRSARGPATVSVFEADRPGVMVSRSAALEAIGKVIYALRLEDGTIKIGCTTNLRNRLNWYGTFEGTVDLLAFKPGGFDQELDIHAALKAHRAKRREYYHPTAEVLAVVNEMRAALGMDALAA